MGGGYIMCGSFEGGDKSGSPLPAVLDDVKALEPALADIALEMVEDDEQSMTVSARHLPVLRQTLPRLVERYRAAFPGTDDWYAIYEAECAAGMDATDGKYGKSIGWRLACAEDLITACDHAAATGEPIVITFD